MESFKIKTHKETVHFMSLFRLFLLLTASLTLLSASIRDLQTFSADFTQTITNDQNATITYKGKFYASRKGNSALWEYNTPVKKRIYYRLGEVIIVEPELEQAIYAKLQKVPDLLKLLKSAKQIGPGLLRTTFDHIAYTIHLSGEKITRIDYLDELGNRVRIRFSHQKQNRYIDPALFVCQIPTGYDILQQR